MPEVQFNSRGTKPCFNVTYFDKDTDTPKDIEKFFAKIYKTMECEPYDNEK
jgi:hypothetical protein